MNVWLARSTLAMAAVVGLVGGALFDRLRTSNTELVTPAPFAVGDSLPPVMLYAGEAGASRTIDLLSPSTRTTLIAFSLGCSNCLGEAEVWKVLSARYGHGRKFIGIACGADMKQLAEFQRLSSVRFPLWTCDRRGMTALRIVANPTIYELTPDGLVLFSASGPDATAAYTRHLEGSRSQ